MQIAKHRFETFGTYNIRSSYDKSLIKLDLADPESVQKTILDLMPDVIINTTALHNVDYCETHPVEAFNINSKAVGLLSEICNKIGARLVHFSTDFVFDGEKGDY